MPREPEGYRDILEDLLSYFGGKRLLCPKEVAAYLGVKDYRTAMKRYGVPREGIAAPLLARRMCK